MEFPSYPQNWNSTIKRQASDNYNYEKPPKQEMKDLWHRPTIHDSSIELSLQDPRRCYRRVFNWSVVGSIKVQGHSHCLFTSAQKCKDIIIYSLDMWLVDYCSRYLLPSVTVIYVKHPICCYTPHVFVPNLPTLLSIGLSCFHVFS